MLNKITIIIVTFNSDKNLFKLLKKLPKEMHVIVVENSNRIEFKKKVEKFRHKTSCKLTGENLGYGMANNIGIKNAKTDYVMILNPDAFVTKNVILKLFSRIRKESKIAVISCETIDRNNKLSKNYYFDKFSKLDKNSNKFKKGLIDVDYFIGSMFLAKKKILLKAGLFDENYFLNFEEIDLFRKIKSKGFRICIEKGIFFKHIKGSSAKDSLKYEMDLSSKWHYSWGQIYFFKKNYGIIFALLFFLKKFCENLIRLIYYLICGKKKNFHQVYYSILGLCNSIVGTRSFYRPKI